MKTRNKFYIFALAFLTLLSLSFARKTPPPPPPCPAILAGRVAITLDPHTGAGTGYAEFGCAFAVPPVVVVTPNYDAQFFVDKFFVVVPDDGVGAGVSVLGEPGRTFTMNWIATVANGPSSGKVAVP